MRFYKIKTRVWWILFSPVRWIKMLPIKLWLWGRQTVWRQWLFTMSIWVTARLKPIKTMANSSWEDDFNGSLDTEFFLSTTQKSGHFFPTNCYFWRKMRRYSMLLFESIWRTKILPSQIFISSCWLLEWLTTYSRPTQTWISQRHSQGHGYLAALNIIKSPRTTVLRGSKNASLLMPSEVSQHN